MQPRRPMAEARARGVPFRGADVPLALGRRALICGVAIFLVEGDADADAIQADPFARIARARAQVRTLEGPFTQTRTISLLATDVLSRGRLTLLRPDRLRWELASPDDVTFWVGPEGLAYRSAHGAGRVPAAASRVGAALEDLRTVLAGDLSKLDQRWDLSVLRDDPSGVAIEAVSKRDSLTAVHRLRFALAGDLVRPTRVELFEGPRDHTVIDFGTLVVNGPVDEAIMRPSR